MARRRLTPPTPGLLPDAEDTIPAEIETKSMFPMGVARTVSRPPIAQVAGEASALAALEGLSAEMARARAEGRIVQRIALDDIAANHLVRDRLDLDDEEMEALTASIRTRGQQVPVEVLDRGEEAAPRYGLISGWRRIAALGAAGVETALAIVRQPATAADAYVAMVEENEIRADISFYERARIVVKALEQGVYDDPKSALQGLFGNVSRAKRSKIKSFMTIVAALDGSLRFPAAISEKAGLDLVRRLEADPGLAEDLAGRLTRAAPQTASEELAILSARPAPPSSPAAAEPFDLHLDPRERTIRISGPRVDEALLTALRRWLAAR
ncbi:ParB/RepB/Spo0J family partition protein [Paenirhodobacter populi]|uniref:Chromosome partitioning protein n=1 Tax=Paenirhodobacter populi TaxID=2306993 RepID=A0A443K4L4_9RHOB|nr:ParB N-terminal domain-containing protein [Sinirhodobacter populi]RWR04647.1 chromosome partitioning protein [Sinirhodobacter populi]RWR27727.1 chromosome partitioning protein [Sinirhodobacter populi]